MTPRTIPSAARAMSEDDLLKSVKELATIFGWWFYHPRYSFGSSKGWPDVALIRPPRFILAELKTDKGKLTVQQAQVIELLKDCTENRDGCWSPLEVYVWRPADLDAITRLLRR